MAVSLEPRPIRLASGHNRNEVNEMKNVISPIRLGPINPTFTNIRPRIVTVRSVRNKAKADVTNSALASDADVYKPLQTIMLENMQSKAALGKADEDAQPCVTYGPKQPNPFNVPLLQVDPNALTERQRIVAFIAARLYDVLGIPLAGRDKEGRGKDFRVVEHAGKLLDEVIRQNP